MATAADGGEHSPPGEEEHVLGDGTKPYGAADYPAAKKEGKVVIVGTSTCTFCTKAKQALRAIVPPHQLVIFDCDTIPAGAAVREAAQRDADGHKTVPMVFACGEFVGGCDTVMQQLETGQLYSKLGVAPPSRPCEGRRPPPPTPALFYFPHTVNSWVVRGTAFQAVACCVVSAARYDELWAGWLMLGLCADFLIRLVAGGNASPAAGLAMVVTSPLQERMVAGAPKQFATGIGTAFSATAAGLLLSGNGIAGAVVCGCLAGPAALEAFLDFCLGCWFFKHMINFGMIPATVNDMHIGQKSLVENQLRHADERESELRPLEVYVHRQPAQPHTDADTAVKARKRDDHKRRGFHPVKQVQLSDFMMPLGVAGLAVAWKLGAHTPGPLAEGTMTDNTVWKVLLYTAAGLFLLLLLLIAAKCVAFPHKVVSELQHPLKSNGCAAGPVTLVLLAFLLRESPGHSVSDATDRLALALFWMGAVLVKLLMLWKIAWLVANRGDGEVTVPGLLLPMAGCCAAALVAPFFEGLDGHSGYHEIGWFFFGLSGLLCVLLVGGSLLESVRYHWSDERTRPSIGMWVVALHMTFLAWTVLTEGTGALTTTQLSASGSTPVAALSPVGHTLYFAGVSLFLVLLWLAVPMGFLLRMKFDFSFWALAPPLDFLACAAMVYHKATAASTLQATFSRGFAYTALALATYGNANLFFQTMYWLVKRRWLRPSYKWAPLSLNKLTHEAFRASGARMVRMAEQLVGQDPPLQLARGLAAEWLEYAVVLEWHAHQEDHVMFREVDAFNPMATRDGYAQHEVLERMEHRLNAAAAALAGADAWTDAARAACATLAGEMGTYTDFMAQHMDWEEENLLALNRRTFNMAIQLRIVRKIWDAYEAMSVEEFRSRAAKGDDVGAMCAAPGAAKAGGDGWEQYDLAAFHRAGRYKFPKRGGDDGAELLSFPPEFPDGELPLAKRQVWRVVLPWVVRNLPMPVMRTRFVRCWAWALPERAQHIGEMIYRGVEDHEWSAVAVDVPEVIPRGLPGWVRRI